MLPLWVWTAIAGLTIGISYAWWSNARAKKNPARPLSPKAVEEIEKLVSSRRKTRAIKALRVHTGTSIIDAKNRVDDWRIDEERASARRHR